MQLRRGRTEISLPCKWLLSLTPSGRVLLYSLESVMGKHALGAKVMRFQRPVISLTTLVMLFLSSPSFAEKRIALVVGNSNYQNVARLNNPSNDARLMADTLRALGFAIVGNEAQIDLDKAGFDNAVRTFGRQLQGAEVGLFYYAGHGLQVRGANYLVPVNANPNREADLDYELEDVGLVLRQMEGSGTRLNMVFLDACRNNPFGGRGLRALETGLAQMRAPEGTLISFATQPGNVAQDGSDGHSPFTAALARTIRKPGLGIFDALNEVGLAVKDRTGGAQQPWFSTSPIKGVFYFAPGTLTPTASPLASPMAVLPPPPAAKRPQTTQPTNLTPPAAPSGSSPALSPPPAVASPAATPPVLPRAVDPKYASETPGKARMHTCVDQYNANKETNGNGGMKWVVFGDGGEKVIGGYWTVCDQKLKGFAMSPDNITTSDTITTSQGDTVRGRSFESLECSKRADALGLHGGERWRFRAECKDNLNGRP